MDKKWLPTPKEHFKLHNNFFGEGSSSCLESEIDDTDLCVRVAQFTAKKIAERLDKLPFILLQDAVKSLLKEIEKS